MEFALQQKIEGIEDAVREAAYYLESLTCTSKPDYELLAEYANKLEQGE